MHKIVANKINKISSF